MNGFKKVALIILGIVALVLIGCFIFINTLKPDYSGTKSLSGLNNKVSVTYDTYGIPHIYADSEKDALRALGYVHAQDRLWQMELLRRIGPGRLSEVFGENEDILKTDKLFLTLGIDEASEKAVAILDKNAAETQMALAYLDGINQFITEGPTPVEFYLTGVEKVPFTLKDIQNVMGYMAFSFAMAHKTDPLLSAIQQKLGTPYLKDLAIYTDPNQVIIKNNPEIAYDSISPTITASVSEALKGLPIPMFEGSNSWVLGSKKTVNGKVIVANDPHIGFSQPSVWYEAHVATPTYEKYGYHLAGVPFPLLGHDRNLAYGITMFENDDIDFYYETINELNTNEYKTENGWESFKTSTKTIKVKDAADVTFDVKSSRHGPIMNEILEQENKMPVAMSWVFTNVKENRLMQAVYGMSHATNLKEFKTALPKIHAPGLNIMYGDAKGNIGWFASAKLYTMPDSVSTKLILDGASGKNELLGYLDFNQNPQAVNPPNNYVYSANNQPDSIQGKLYPGYYLPENRAKRITEFLDTNDLWDIEKTKIMITDVTAPINVQIFNNLENALNIKELNKEQVIYLDQLHDWNGTYELDDKVGPLFHRWVYNMLEGAMKDELGAEMFNQVMETHFLKRLIEPLSKNKTSVWWDDVSSNKTKETMQHVVTKAFINAYESLITDFGTDYNTWTWNKVHTLEHGHPMGQVEALRSYFNVGPFPVHGTREVLNNMGFPYTKEGFYKVTTGPSTRRIIDFSDVENSVSILPTGQSGNPFSEHYKDQAEMYANGEFRKMMMNKDEIHKTGKSVLIFEPK